MKKLTYTLTGLLAVVVIVSSAAAAEWGSLKGRFVVDGSPAKLPPLLVNKDDYCINEAKPINDAVVIGKDNALVNACVYLQPITGKKVDVNPEYDAKMKEPAVLDNKGCSFHPHIVMARVGQKLVIKNSDPVGHNTNVELFSFNPIVPAGEKTEVTDSIEAVFPRPIHCNIHPWMTAYLISLKHPYAAVSGEDGKFEIKDIPAGTNEFHFWHELNGNLKNLKFKVGMTDAKGRVKIAIKAGETLDLGDIKVPASALTPR